MYCEETVYAAGVCEKLKSCVLCKAWKRELSTCDQCQITVTVVNNLSEYQQGIFYLPVVTHLGLIITYVVLSSFVGLKNIE